MKKLIEAALAAREFAYSPYSNFAVGAALLTESGNIYTGCNIENASYSPTICAERTAIFKAVSEGESSFTAIAICGGMVGKPPTDYCMPCGVCRQVMGEFCSGDFKIISIKSETEYREHTLGELLPYGFDKSSLE